MPLSSFLQRLRGKAASAQPEAEQPPLSASDVEATRVRARRRLIGMVVLVGAGIIGFPWLFETQPRPMSPDVQMVRAGDVPGGRVDGGASGKVAMSEVPVETPAPALEKTEPPQDDRHIVNRWAALKEQHGVDLVVCVAAALRRGIKDEVLAPGFRISGLGQLVDAGIKADRTVTFGG